MDGDIEPGELAAIRQEAEVAHQQAAAAYQNGLGSAAICNATAAAYSAIAASVNDDWGLSFEITYSDAAREASRRAAHAIADTSPNQWMSVNAAERTRQASMIRCLFDDLSVSVL
ncbi:MAG: hypothetical protein JNM56_29140 [Planctomycetia bacterium]|nr:hypothetical protein [Planctomycetia bacterium]